MVREHLEVEFTGVVEEGVIDLGTDDFVDEHGVKKEVQNYDREQEHREHNHQLQVTSKPVGAVFVKVASDHRRVAEDHLGHFSALPALPLEAQDVLMREMIPVNDVTLCGFQSVDGLYRRTGALKRLQDLLWILSARRSQIYFVISLLEVEFNAIRCGLAWSGFLKGE